MVKGAGLKIPCVSFVGSNPTFSIQLKIAKLSNSNSTKSFIDYLMTIEPAPLAQSVERGAYNAKVTSSSLVRSTLV